MSISKVSVGVSFREVGFVVSCHQEIVSMGTKEIVAELKASMAAAIDRFADSLLSDIVGQDGRSEATAAKIVDLGLQGQDLKQLSPAAQRLTKDEMLAYWKGNPSTAVEQITIHDLKVIKNALWDSFEKYDPSNRDTYNCCCCCCAVAVADPPRPVA